jgi:hypothetical protein
MHIRAVRYDKANIVRSLAAFLLAVGLVALAYPCLQTSSGSGASIPPVPVFQKGISYTAWSHEAYTSRDSEESLKRIMEVNVDWVAICVWWFQDHIDSTRIYPRPDLYTASSDSVIHAISLAHSLGLKVMLKPMVDVVDQPWRGAIPPSPEWFESYEEFINFFAEIAEAYDVELFCVGCEFDANDISAPHWRAIVSGVRSRYSGPLTYAAGPTRVQHVEWWDTVDYVGIDAYYPLTDTNEPTRQQLMRSWNSIADVIEAWQATVGKPIIFTEIGYRSGDGSNSAPWAWSGDLSVDLEEQADCYEAALSVLWNRSWFHGFYWWNWETDPSAGGTQDDGYTPQNKPAQETLAGWYAKAWDDRVPFPVDGRWFAVSLIVIILHRLYEPRLST